MQNTTKGTVLITGASEGIGKALIKKYLNEGYHVIGISRNEDKLREITNQLEDNLVDLYMFFECDVSIKDMVDELFDKLSSESIKIDIAILNAGISRPFSFLEFDLNKYRTVYETNLFGVLNFMNRLIPLFKEQGGGQIAAISSVADVRGFPSGTPYSSAKSALSHTLEGSRIELRKANIYISNIRPGYIKTKLVEKNKTPMPFIMSADKAAKRIYLAIKRRRKVYTFPKRMYLTTQIVKFLPNFIFDFVTGLQDVKKLYDFNKDYK